MDDNKVGNLHSSCLHPVLATIDYWGLTVTLFYVPTECAFPDGCLVAAVANVVLLFQVMQRM